MGLMIALVGRFVTWLLVVLALIAVIGAALVFILPRLPHDAGAIDPAQALANGGHTVRIYAVAHNGVPLPHGQFAVETHSGQPPVHSKGDLAGNMAEFVVGADWIGQVRIFYVGRCDYLLRDHNELTSLIGEPYGWDDRTVTFLFDC